MDNIEITEFNEHPSIMSMDQFKAWEKCGLLKNIPEELKFKTATLLENQRLFNETNEDDESQIRFKRISIPIMRRLAPVMGKHISDYINYNLDDSYTYYKTSVLYKTCDHRNHSHLLNLQCDAEAVARDQESLAKEVKDLIEGDPEIRFYDLRLTSLDAFGRIYYVFSIE